MTINFAGNTITGTIAIQDGATIKSDNGAATIFVPATEGHYVLMIDNGDGTYNYTVTAEVPGDAVARIDNRYFTTLQGAANVAKDGETIVVLKDITTDKPVEFTTAVTLNGENFKIESSANNPAAFVVKGNGDVTINKVDLVATAGDAIEVNDGYAGKLTVNDSKITTAKRGIDVQEIAEGFGLTVNSTTVQSNVENPKTQYVNTNNTDPQSAGRGINFSNDPVSAEVLITNSTIQGFAYGVNVSDNSGKLNLTLLDGTFYGRAVVNNWGEGSTFNLNNMAVNGLNNETEGSNEFFATIVDNGDAEFGEANYNNYNINNSTFTGTVAENASPNASESFIELRGNSARVKILGNSTFTYNGDANHYGGFTNETYFKNLVNNNKVWFDETAKSFFKPLVESFNSDAYGNVTILDELDPVVNLYPIGTFEAGVVMNVTDDNGHITKYYFKDLASALTSPKFGEDVTIELLEDQTLDKDFTVTVPFTLNLVEGEETHTITGNGKFKVEPVNSVTVLGGSTATDNLFAVADDYVLYAGIIKDGTTDPTYYAGNVYYDGIDSYSYFDFLFDEDRDEVLVDEGYVRVEKLENPFRLDKSLVVPEDVNTFYLDVDNERFIIRDGNSIVLRPFPETYAQDGPEVYVTEEVEDLFSSADPEYTVMVDDVNVEKDGVTYTKKYYLMKDGLSVVVAPATYCSHKQTPSVIVKKRVEKEGEPGEYEWKTLNPGTDYTVTLVPNEEEDAYIAAKTYANSVIVEGITFQGRRKADFIINPRNINDCTVNGTSATYRTSGYTANDIAEMVSVEYGCIITEHNATNAYILTRLNPSATTPAKADYKLTIHMPEGLDKIVEMANYKDVIEVTALEGKDNGTQNFVGNRFEDFTVVAPEGIDMAKVLVTSKAVYTSVAQQPTKDLIKVVYNNHVLSADQYELEVHGAESDYVDAKTYSNAITLKGTMTGNPYKFYGSVNADYVIAPRDLADAEMGNDKGLVSLTKVSDMTWTGSELTPNINTTTNNNIALTMDYQATTNGTYKLLEKDYSYTIEPSPMKDPGEYKVIFTGRGNFTGMNEVKIAVLKDINTVDAEIALQVIPGVNETNYESGRGLNPETDLVGVTVKDGETVLVDNEHYTITVEGQSGATYSAEKPIKREGVYKAHIAGKYPYYSGVKPVIEFPAVFEYYTAVASNVKPSANKFGIHVTSGVDRTATVGTLNGIAVAENLQTLTIDPTKTVTVGGPSQDVILTIKGIDDNAFNGTNNLHYVDASQLDDYTPSSLSRTADGPFNGIRKQAIVYLDGDDVIGENYVYETSAGDYRCDEFKIYDDIQGNQKGFEDEDYKWEIINKYEFTAATLTNTRRFLKDQHYTTCLPYDLPLATSMKAYTLTAASDNMFGFREIEGETLTAFMPYILIPSADGNMLSTTDVIVKKTDTFTEAEKMTMNDGTTHHGYQLNGSTIYKDQNATTGFYIMQSGNQWKRINSDQSWDGACVLPMRAYISYDATGGSREFMGAKFIDAVEKTATDMAGDDWSNAEVYDMQGRKVDTTKSSMRKGVYIVNGQKRIRK